MLLSLDANKSLDNVKWPFLWEVMKHFGMGSRFIAWTNLLYNSCRARIMVNGTTLVCFPLAKGTSYGCPLLPLLFALVIEP